MVAATSTDIKIPAIKLKKIITDPAATARAVKLLYVNDSEEGIIRIKKGKGFQYRVKKKPVKEKSTLRRIHSLVIPPAWQNVWICTSANGHLQVTGQDTLKRKQYRYHPLWIALRNQTKFYHMLAFGKKLPAIRKQINQSLSLPGMPKEKVLALVVLLMDKTSIRIGNGAYEKMYGSFGITTLKDNHVNIRRNAVRFTFKGKKGVAQNVSLTNKKLAKLIKQCKDIPGKELFQ